MIEDPTKFDLVLKGFKNHRVAVWILVVGVSVIAVANFTNAMRDIWTLLRPLTQAELGMDPDGKPSASSIKPLSAISATSSTSAAPASQAVDEKEPPASAFTGPTQKADAIQPKVKAQGLLDEAAARHGAETERQRQRYVTASNSRAHRLVLVNSSSRRHEVLTERFAEAVTASTGLLSDAFVSDGMFGEVMGGNYKRLRALEMERVVALMVLGDVRSRADSSVVAGENVFRSTVHIRVVVVRPSDDYSTESFSVDATGSGFSIEAAERRAIDQAADIAVSKLTQYR